MGTVREGASAPRKDKERLAIGTSVGRYLIVNVLGEGGMGVVYAAYDPELDRKVAIKLLQARTAGGERGDQAWLLREAQALARLSHPNVIDVHDVGTLPGDRVFVAMALVEGTTLRAWMKAGRGWREVVAMLRGAGAGLAAAHAVDLVHRDFKPDNVLVGRDGRPRLMDFGLARLRPPGELSDEHAIVAARTSDLAIEVNSPLNASLTIAGSVLGTPAYMAPEIYDGKPADARSDQFAFGVTLYEALYRVRPFDRAQLGADRTAPPEARKPPAEAGVPARVERVVMRALAADPAARFSSMNMLLAELAIDPTASRRRALYATGAIGLVAIAVGTGFALSNHRHVAPITPPVCAAARELATVWDAAIADKIGKAFAGKRPFADRAFAATKLALDAYAAEWTAAATENCEATRVRAEQPPDVMALRQACLDDRRAELREVTHLLAEADAPVVDRADKIAWSLEPVKRCADVIALRAPGLPSPAIADLVADLRTRLATAKALASVGRLEPAIAAAAAVVTDARALAYPSILAEALAVQGSALMHANKFALAAPVLAEATLTALRSKRDALAAVSALTAAQVASTGLNRPDEARVWLGIGAAEVARIGDDQELQEEALEAEGTVAGERGDLVAALAAHEKARALGERVWGASGPAQWHAEYLLAATLAKTGAWGDAIPHFERALTLREAAVADHPDVALILSSLGAAYQHVGEAAKATAAYQRALAIREHTFGATSPVLIATLNNMADLARDTNDLAVALTLAERARAIAEIAPGKMHPLYHTVVTTVGEIQLAAGHVADARATLDATILLEVATKSPLLPTTLASRAEVAVAERQWAVAAELAARAIAGFETSEGKDAADLWRPLATRGRALIELHKPAEAGPLLARAIAIGERAKVKATDLGPARESLAHLPK